MLTAFETVVPSYDLDTGIDRTQIETFNDYVKKHTNLFEVGGSFYNTLIHFLMIQPFHN